MAEAVTAIETIAAPIRQQRIEFEVLAAFVDPDPAVFLSPTVTSDFRTLHERLHAAVPPAAQPVRYYRPGAWNPHCTLAWHLTRENLPQAFRVALEVLSLPVVATVERLGIVDTPREVELRSFDLAS
jgi:hypothetical protein